MSSDRSLTVARFQRAAGWSLLAVQAVSLAKLTDGAAVPAAVALLALPGVFLAPRVALSLDRRVVGALLLALPFALLWRLTPYRGATSVILSEGVGQLIGQYFLVLQMLLFYVRPAESGPGIRGRPPEMLPVSLPAFGAVVMACAGDFFTASFLADGYPFFATAFGALTAVYLTLSTAHPLRVNVGYVVLSGLTLAAAGALAWSASAAIIAARPQLDRIDNFLVDPAATLFGLGHVGFSDQGSLGSVTHRRTQAEKRPALRIFAEHEPGYLRGRAFLDYNHARWDFGTSPRRLAIVPALPELPRASTGRLVGTEPRGDGPWKTYEVWPSAVYPVAFVPLGTTLLATDSDRVLGDSEGVFSSTDSTRYTAYVPGDPPAPVLEDAAGHLAVPLELDPRIRALADRLLADCRTTSEKAAAVTAFLHSGFKYRLGIRVPPGQDPLAYFLFESRAAHCEYFATAAAILLRLGGVPCRYVTGFVATERNEYGGYWLARNRDAHAWVEAFDPEPGWFIVEATPEAGVPTADGDRGVSGRWDALKLTLLQFRITAWKEGFRGVGRWLLERVRSVRVAVWPLLAIAVLVAAAWAFRRRSRRHRRKAAARRAVAPHVVALNRLLAGMDRQVARYGFQRLPHETLHRFAERLTAAPETDPFLAEAAAWYRRYAELRYASVSPDFPVSSIVLPKPSPRRS